MGARFEKRRSLLWRLLAGAVLVVAGTASATALAGFGEIQHLEDALKGPSIPRPGTKPVPPGKPQTILLLGSDKRPNRSADGGGGGGARSDTIILARLDPDRGGISLLSLPRDLSVLIPGHGRDKINAAYEEGGPALVVKTVEGLTGLGVNHVVNVDFGGFERAINAIGCVYVDVDRRYFNDSADYAAIDVPAGYQRLCGQKALQYARFRHEDTDLVRGARQQAVLSAIKQRIGLGTVLKRRREFESILGRATTTDADFKKPKTLLGLARLAALSASKPIRQIPFAGRVRITAGDAATNTPSVVEADRPTIRRLVRRFLGHAGAVRHGARPRPKAVAAGVEPARAAGLEQAVRVIRGGAGWRLPVWYPSVLAAGARYEAPRVYRLTTPSGRREPAYRIVARSAGLGEYYGVQGTTWRDPPILQGQSERVRVGSRTFEVHSDGGRVKLVAWRTSKGVYWVSNTLLGSLTRRQMLAIARTTRLP